MHDNSREQLLWNEIKEGNQHSFKELYDLYSDILYGYGMKLVKDADFVTEIVQSLFVYIYEKRTNLNTPVSVVAYMFISFRRMLFAEKGKKSRFNELQGDDKLQAADEFNMIVDMESAIIHTEEDRSQAMKLHAVLASLSPQQREIVYLKYYKGLKNEQIAQALNIQHQVERNVLSQALKKLKVGLTAFILYMFVRLLC